MNAPQSQAEGALQALLALIEADRARQCGAILGAAQASAAAVRAQAQQQSRERVRQAFAEQRQHHQAQLHAAQARLATLRRQHAQQHTASLLQLAWQRLPEALHRLWQQPPTRAAWVTSAMQAARSRLPRGAWRVVHAHDWPAAEWQAQHDALAHHLGMPAQFVASADIRAGLKVDIDGNVIDATLDALLGSRREVEARLVRLLEPAP
jgi:hypothetical protein